ncbi:MAG: hypothetical protein K2I21_11960 [Acetatifactor sp.]|nr:hypothetical protein [Acetatifactor sp.]
MKDYTNTKIAANYFRGAEAVGGHIFFDESGMTFKSHIFNIQTGETRIAYRDIVKVSKGKGIIPTGISVFDRNGFEHKFIIYHRKQVIQFLQSRMHQRTE